MPNPFSFLDPKKESPNSILTPLPSKIWSDPIAPITKAPTSVWDSTSRTWKPEGWKASNPLAAPITGTSTLPSTENQQQGSLTDFSNVMRAVSKSVYQDRQGKEGKVAAGQFDPTKVSGSIFKQIMNSVESNRGNDISKVYGSAVDAAKFDLQQKEQARQDAVAQENKKFDIIKQKTELGIDSVYIPSGSLADRNNNPGNLRFVGQTGATMGEGGFAKFASAEDGFQALINQVQLDQSRGLTLQQFIAKYAPPTENDTSLYVTQMAQWLGVDPSMKLSDIDTQKLAENIAKKESGTQMVTASSSTDADTALAKQFKSGTITATQIPAAKRGKVLDIAMKLGQEVSPENKTVMMSNVQIVDEILADDNYEAISGGSQIFGTGNIPFMKGRQTGALYNQLKGIVALDKRQMLKGQGAISDFEFKVLNDAASALTRLSSEEDFRRELIKIRGAFSTAAGNTTKVRVTNASGYDFTGELGRDAITDAISQGFKIEYV